MELFSSVTNRLSLCLLFMAVCTCVLPVGKRLAAWVWSLGVHLNFIIFICLNKPNVMIKMLQSSDDPSQSKHPLKAPDISVCLLMWMTPHCACLMWGIYCPVGFWYKTYLNISRFLMTLFRIILKRRIQL